jgi:hypothetical protein
MIDPMLPEESHVSVTSRILRQFAGMWVVLFSALAYWKGILADDSFWTIRLGLGIVPGLLGLAFPAFIRPLFVFLMAITFPIGLVVSNVILGLMYYGIITPVGLFFRLIGRDALARKFPTNADTYWCPKPQPADLRSYFRQS